MPAKKPAPVPAEPAKTALAPVTGREVDALYRLKAKYSEAQKKADAIKAEISALEEAYIERMLSNGTTVSAGSAASLSLSESYYPSVTDWDAVWAKVRKEKTYPPLLQRRMSDALWREMYLDKKLVPGTEAFLKRRLSLTKKG